MEENFEYDALAYPGLVFSKTNPAAIATLATMNGIAAAPPDRCKVLELGCGAGMNLLAQAYCFPKSAFLGVDLASAHIEYGNEAATRIGIQNASLRRADIMELDAEELGKFDYIVAHGLYSWVPDAVRDKVLELYRDCLTENGVGYISFNAYPGCRLREMLWDYLRYFTREVSDVEEKVKNSLMLGRVLEGSIPDGRLHKEIYKNEVEMLFDRSAPLIFHDDLSPALKAFYFYEFAAALEANDLQYLCETDVGSSFTGNLNEIALKLLQTVDADLIAREQMFDFIKCRRFRSSLICRKEVAVDRSFPADLWERFLLSAEFLPTDADANLLDKSNVQFKGRDGNSLTTDEPLLKVIAKEIGKAWPRAVTFRELVDRIKQIPAFDDNFDAELARTKDSLKQLQGAGLLKLSVYEPPIDQKLAEKPESSAFARFQLEQNSKTVCALDGSVHDADDAVMRSVILAANGERDRDQILAEVTVNLQIPPEEEDDFLASLPKRVDELLKDLWLEGFLLPEDRSRAGSFDERIN